MSAGEQTRISSPCRTTPHTAHPHRTPTPHASWPNPIFPKNKQKVVKFVKNSAFLLDLWWIVVYSGDKV